MIMLAIIAVLVTLSILASVLVITASMLSSRLSRVEDRFIAEDYEVEESPPQQAVGDTPHASP